MLAIEHLACPESLRFLLVLGPEDSDDEGSLWGLFPLEVQSKCLHLPIRTLAFWQHDYCFLAVPLIDAGHVREVLDEFWKWFERNPLRCSILDTNYLLADRPLIAEWAETVIGRTSLVLREYPRAFLSVNGGTASNYVRNSVSKKHHDEFLRQERRLGELGELEYRQVENLSEVDEWVDAFLRLESSGWKGGPGGGAFALQRKNAAYLRAITRAGFVRNRVVLLSLLLNGNPIAMKHNLLSGDGGFTFKIAFDERYSKYSPGLLLELENIRLAFQDPRIRWLDSCALARHPMANRIWSERRMISRTLFSNGSRWGDFRISLLPLLRWMNRQVRRDRE